MESRRGSLQATKALWIRAHTGLQVVARAEMVPAFAEWVNQPFGLLG